MPTNPPVNLFCLENTKGLRVKLADFGASIVSVEMVDRHGDLDTITLGFDDLDQYRVNPRLLGATVGRYCGRIAGAQFEIDEQIFSVTNNHGTHHIHGGTPGFSHVFWQSELGDEKISFRHLSPWGDQGYPGNLEVTLTYSLTPNNELICNYRATTDHATPINLTNHSYWNLGGVSKEHSTAANIFDHTVQLNAKRYLELDAALIPTGELCEVGDTPLDFSSPKPVGTQMAELGEGLGEDRGFDHCFVIDGPQARLNLAGIVSHPQSGRVLTVRTTQPGVQFYTANFLDGSPACGGYSAYAGLCLETQHFPDSPHHPHFPNTILYPGDTFEQTTVFEFSTL